MENYDGHIISNAETSDANNSNKTKVTDNPWSSRLCDAPDNLDVTTSKNCDETNISCDKEGKATDNSEFQYASKSNDKDISKSVKSASSETTNSETSMSDSKTIESNSMEENMISEVSKGNNPDSNSLIDNQVQCINLHCQSGVDLAEAPVFALSYFGIARRKNVSQKVCQECFLFALNHQEKMCELLKRNEPIMSVDFPEKKDDVVVMDSVEEIYEEEILPDSVISLVEEELMNLVANAVNKYNVDFQLRCAEDILNKKYEALEAANTLTCKRLNKVEKKLARERLLMYKTFTPKSRSLLPISITDRIDENQFCGPKSITWEASGVKRFKEILPKPPPKSPPTKQVRPNEPVNYDSRDVVALAEVESPKIHLPPIGKLIYPTVLPGASVFTMKTTSFGVWVRGKVLEIIKKLAESPPVYRVRLDIPVRGRETIRNVTGKEMAYAIASKVRYPVGTRVVALFHSLEGHTRDAHYAGVIAEPPKTLNNFRYLVFFDDGYAQYVPHKQIYLVCEASWSVHEDIHPNSRDFIKSYLDQYPERPMVKLQQGQLVKTEWNGKWCIARVVKVDGSLAKMHFEAYNRSEWIYRGSTRLGPLYSELIAAAARKEQGALSRHRSLGIASLKKRNMPYVEYSVDQDDAKSPQTPVASKNVAKKSTGVSKGAQVGERPARPLRPNEKREYTTKGYVRTIDLTGRLPGRPFQPHQCGPSCISWPSFSPSSCKEIGLLAIPIFFGFEREFALCKTKKTVMYVGPCGRRIRNIVEMHRYLKVTKCGMGLDYFNFDHRVRALDEFHLEPNMYCTHVKDISYGRENTPVSCVNEINHSWPAFMDYSTSRLPQDGVNINLDPEFLVSCSCTDDCQDKQKCECWQLTIEHTKLGPTGKIDPGAGYHYKRLLEPVPTGIYECNQKCKCSQTCLNRVAQHPLQLNLQVFRTLRKGWGLRTINDIPQGTFICIYAGRLLTEQSANDGGRMYGDEYLAELDYIEVIERLKEGYENEVVDPEISGENNSAREDDDDDECEDELDELDDSQMNSDDCDYVPQGLKNLTQNVGSTVNTRGRRKKVVLEEKSESEGEKDKDEEEVYVENPDEDDDEIKKKPSKFTAAMPVEEVQPKNKSVRELFGDGADDCYIMDAKYSGNIGRYLNHSCQPNVFVQNVFVDTHDVRFPWVAFFALTYIKAGTELTWDYSYDVGSVPDKVLYCYCNSAECRGRLL